MLTVFSQGATGLSEHLIHSMSVRLVRVIVIVEATIDLEQGPEHLLRYGYRICRVTWCCHLLHISGVSCYHLFFWRSFCLFATSGYENEILNTVERDPAVMPLPDVLISKTLPCISISLILVVLHSRKFGIVFFLYLGIMVVSYIDRV